MEENIVYREIYPEEEKLVCEMVIECFNEFVAPEYSDEGVKEFVKYVDADCMKDRLKKGNFVLVAVDCNSIIGAIEMRSYNHISLLFVKKEYFNRGIAKALLTKVIAKCRQVNTELKSIDVNSSPYAEKIYERLCFVKKDTEQIKNGIRFIPMVLQVTDDRHELI